MRSWEELVLCEARFRLQACESGGGDGPRRAGHGASFLMYVCLLHLFLAPSDQYADVQVF